MSLSRQIDLAVLIPDEAQAPVVGVSSHWPSQSEKTQHTHSRHQLMYSQKGVIHVSTPTGSWILPPTKSIWISGGTPHALLVKRPVELTNFMGGSGRSRRATLDRLQRRERLPAYPRTALHLFSAALGLRACLSLFASRAGSSRTTRNARAGSVGATRVERSKGRTGCGYAQSGPGGPQAARRVGSGGRCQSQDDRTPLRCRNRDVFRQMARAAADDYRAGTVGTRGQCQQRC
jgi:hypothetical protein